MKKITALLFAITFIFATTSKQIYSVNGMMCGYGCVSTIKNSLNSLDGIKSVSVYFETKTMEVILEDENFESDVIIKSLPNPYKASLIQNFAVKQYMIDGMTCMGCVNTIEKSIDGLDGLEHYDIDIREQTLLIEYDKKTIDEKKILSQIPQKYKVVEINTKTEEVLKN